MTYTALVLSTFDGDDQYTNLVVGKSLDELQKAILRVLVSNDFILDGYLFEIASGMEMSISCAAKDVSKDVIEALIGDYYSRSDEFGVVIASENSTDLSTYHIESCVYKEVEDLIAASLEKTQIDVVRNLGYLDHL